MNGVLIAGKESAFAIWVESAVPLERPNAPNTSSRRSIIRYARAAKSSDPWQASNFLRQGATELSVPKGRRRCGDTSNMRPWGPNVLINIAHNASKFWRGLHHRYWNRSNIGDL